MTATTETIPYTKPANHYIDNKKFLAALVEFREKVLHSKETNTDLPLVTNYIGECFMQIAQHLSYKSNFINYSYKDEMVSDAIENCLSCVTNFDPKKSENPFAYFTQVSYFAFIRRIQKEQKQAKTKYQLIKNIDIDALITQEHDAGEFTSQYVDYLKKQLDYVDTTSEAPKEKKKPGKKKKEAVSLPIDTDEV